MCWTLRKLGATILCALLTCGLYCWTTALARSAFSITHCETPLLFVILGSCVMYSIKEASPHHARSEDRRIEILTSNCFPSMGTSFKRHTDFHNCQVIHSPVRACARLDKLFGSYALLRRYQGVTSTALSEGQRVVTKVLSSRSIWRLSITPCGSRSFFLLFQVPQILNSKILKPISKKLVPAVLGGLATREWGILPEQGGQGGQEARGKGRAANGAHRCQQAQKRRGLRAAQGET